MKTGASFSERQRDLLVQLVERIIPASEKYGIPGADDEVIFDTILDKCLGYEALVGEGLDRFLEFVQAKPGTPGEWTSAQWATALEEFEVGQGAFVAVVTMVTAQAYYQDARVLESLGMEARPPFPQGQELPQGDWSLLDPVRERGKRYRDA